MLRSPLPHRSAKETCRETSHVRTHGPEGDSETGNRPLPWVGQAAPALLIGVEQQGCEDSQPQQGGVHQPVSREGKPDHEQSVAVTIPALRSYIWTFAGTTCGCGAAARLQR